MKKLYEKGKMSVEDIDRLRRLRLIDDEFMTACFDGFNEGTELILRIILSRDDLKVKDTKGQVLYKNLNGRDLRLDVVAEDEQGKVYNIEIQRDSSKAEGRRARYHSSLLDSKLLKPGAKFKKLPDTFVIFITEHDVFRDNEPVYWFVRSAKKSGRELGDGSNIVYVNGAYRDPNTELGLLMRDFFCENADEMHYKVLADRVRQFKENEKGVREMSGVLDEIREEGFQRGEKRGEKKGKEKTTILHIQSIMESLDMSAEDAMKALRIPLKDQPKYLSMIGKR